MSATESQAKALTGAVTIAGIGLIVVASSWLDWILVLVLLAMAESQRKRNDYALEDCVACLLDWGTEAIHLVNQRIGETLRFEQVRSRLISAAVNQLPMGEQIAAMFEKRKLSSDVLPQLLRRCSFVVGESGDGKTHVLHWLAQEFIRGNPNGEILIG